MGGNVFKKKWGTGEVTIEGQTIAELDSAEVDSFVNGVGIVTSNVMTGNIITGFRKWIVIAGCKMTAVNYYVLSQVRYMDGIWERRNGTYVQDVETDSDDWVFSWDAWHEYGYAEKADTLSGYGINDAFTKEETVDEIERLINLISFPEEVKQLRENELSALLSGYAFVESSETIDSEGGPIVTTSAWPVIAEQRSTFGSVAVTQTRIHNGCLERREGYIADGIVSSWSPWENYLSQILDDLSTIYRYMGTLKTCADLPDHADVGNVWNIEQKSYITDQVISIQNATCSFSPDGSDDPVIGVTYHLSESLGHTGTHFIRMYDSKDNKAVKWERRVTVTENSIYFSFKQSEGCDFHYDGTPVNTYLSFIDHPEYGVETINVIAVNAGDNVAWNGTRWDVLAGTVDLSAYVEKTDVATTAVANKLLKLNDDGKLPASITGDSSTVGGKHAADFAEASHVHGDAEITDVNWEKIQNTPSSISGYGIGDAYTKDEVDSKLSTVYNYRGTVYSTKQLPSQNRTVGDVYNIETAGGLTSTLKLIPVTNVSITPMDPDNFITWNELYLSMDTAYYTDDMVGSLINIYNENGQRIAIGSMFSASSGSITDVVDAALIKYIQIQGQETNSNAAGVEVTATTHINAGDNVAWNGTNWDVLAGTVDLTGYVKGTDYATNKKAGVVAISPENGLFMKSGSSTGWVAVYCANTADIRSRISPYRPITPSNLDYAVRSVLPLTSDTLPATLAANTEYYLGESAALSFAFPDTGDCGQYCFVKFISGAAATALTVTGSNYTGTLPTPAANKTYEILATWNGEQWVCSYRGY